jgi:hypothetical protein
MSKNCKHLKMSEVLNQMLDFKQSNIVLVKRNIFLIEKYTYFPLKCCLLYKNLYSFYQLGLSIKETFSRI